MLFTEDHEKLRETCRQFIDKEINPYVEEWEENSPFPAHELFKKMAKLDLLGITKPVEYGGMGLDYSYGLVLAEELGRVKCAGVPTAIGVQTDMATPALARFGSDEVKKEFLAPSIAGDYVACIGVSEPQAGSDVANTTTRAVKDGGDYIINGTKMWITNATQGDWVCLLVNTGEGTGYMSKSMIAVPLKTKGITISPKLNKLGLRSSDTAQIFFDDVRVPCRNLIGDEGKGFIYQMIQFQEERMFAAGCVLKGMEAVINATIDYTRERYAFGKPLINNQVIHFRLAELQTEVEALRALIYRACEEYISGKDVTLLASMAKLKAGRLGREVSDACLQYWGGQGFMWDSEVARTYRDMRLISIGGGADEVMLLIISKIMDILPADAL
ncbi:acyl-CoA dehydrogenase family protein [Deltaproteobacteria bacterium TL4]